ASPDRRAAARAPHQDRRRLGRAPPRVGAGTAAVKRLHYAWTVAAVTFVVLLVAAGIRSTPRVLLVPLEQEFGWSRASISTAIALNLVLYGLIGPFGAAVIDR